jgi:hypothetical protein
VWIWSSDNHMGRGTYFLLIFFFGHLGWNRMPQLFERRLANLDYYHVWGYKSRAIFRDVCITISRLHTYAITYSNDAFDMLGWIMWLDSVVISHYLMNKISTHCAP